MRGSAGDASRWTTCAQPAAFLTRSVTRLCLDAMRSARARREAYVGNWLPEPIIEPEADELRVSTS